MLCFNRNEVLPNLLLREVIHEDDHSEPFKFVHFDHDKREIRDKMEEEASQNRTRSEPEWGKK